MFAYAVTSIKLRDFEPAIATLERMLIYRNDLPRVKLELGSAYFQLGSYEVSKFYFKDALDSDPPPHVRAKVEEFMAEIDRRTRKSGFSGSASLGLAYSSNANLGPSDRLVEVFGQDAQLDSQYVEAGDFGVKANLRLNHTLDLNRPNDDVWLTDFAATTLHFFEETTGDLDAFLLRTGPRLALDNDSYGPKIRPYVDAGYVRSGNEDLYLAFGGGAQFSNTIDSETSVFAELAARYRNYTSEQNASDAQQKRNAAIDIRAQHQCHFVHQQVAHDPPAGSGQKR